jgi:hypothetical protein
MSNKEKMLTWLLANYAEVTTVFERGTYTDTIAVRALRSEPLPAFRDDWSPHGKADTIEVCWDTRPKRFTRIAGFGEAVEIGAANLKL